MGKLAFSVEERRVRANIAADLRRFAGEIMERPRDSKTQRVIANARVRLVLSLARKIEDGEGVSDG